MTEGFLNFIEHEKRYSAHTLTAYRNDLAQFSEFLRYCYDTNDLSAANRQMIRSWIVQLVNEGLSPVTVRRKLSSLKGFYKYLMACGQTDQNPAIDIQPPQSPERLPVFVPESSVGEMLDATIYPDGFEGKRDRCILEMFYDTGMRLSELIGLKHGDIDFSNGNLRVMGKRSKERIIPIGKKLRKCMQDYQTERDGAGFTEAVAFFLTRGGKKLYPKLVYKVVNAYLSKVTTIKKRSPHILRHSFATHMLNQGADINAVKEILGHASLAATQIYTHNTIEKLKKVYKQAHPRA